MLSNIPLNSRLEFAVSKLLRGFEYNLIVEKILILIRSADRKKLGPAYDATKDFLPTHYVEGAETVLGRSASRRIMPRSEEKIETDSKVYDVFAENAWKKDRARSVKARNSLCTEQARFVCPIKSCSKIFTRKAGLTIHTNAIHTKKDPFRCPKCPMRFYYNHHLKTHLASKHGDGKTFVCYLCRKPSLTKQHLQKHTNSLHTHRVRFTCTFTMCSKSFTRKSSWKRHINTIHFDENEFECPERFKEFY